MMVWFRSFYWTTRDVHTRTHYLTKPPELPKPAGKVTEEHLISKLSSLIKVLMRALTKISLLASAARGVVLKTVESIVSSLSWGSRKIIVSTIFNVTPQQDIP